MANRGFLSAFEQATGIDVPDQIAGITIPDPDIGDVGELAADLLDNVGNFGDLVEKATKAREVVASGRRTAGNCWGVIDSAQDIYSTISEKIEPLSPLLRMNAAEIPQAVALFNKQSLDACVAIVGEVLDLGKLLQKIANILAGVKSIFEAVMETCGDIIEKVREFMADVAEALAEALHLEGALGGIMDLCSGLTGVVSDMADISGTLSPVLQAWEEANFFAAATFAVSHFEEVKDALLRFWPAWESSQEQYGNARGIGEGAFCKATDLYQKYKQTFHQLCKMVGKDVPGGDDEMDERAVPTVATREGIVGLDPFEPL